MSNNVEPLTQEGLKATIKDFLNSHPKAVFGILDKEGLPTTSLMLYVVDEGLNVLFGTRKSFSKYANILAHSTVSLTVVDAEVDPKKTVDIRGCAVEVSPEQLDEMHAYFKIKNPAIYYIEGADDFVMFKITPSFIRFSNAETGQLEIVDLDLKVCL